ncbi:MobF family relaxase [Arthrobacter sp. SDTb3-6]|uniref:MobF family relaxase n=1 Tax=Arthrobacter sp. SDTb3-6 TaxID=2713571 RepID=UPI00159D4CCF|nr:MobF family relaxase [Arthrobacter sp. SDTb3-6]NVM98422.1 relaxase domain-containing protein [Arthrobacter sp. SDTb3-6]
MTVSIARLSTEAGVSYLLKTTSHADVETRDLTGYYTAASNPPGQWLGAGLAGIGMNLHDTVTDAAAKALFERGEHPSTGASLGRTPNQASTVTGTNGQTVRRAAVAGFDLTFSVPKSVSVLWALSDAEYKDRVMAAHHAAMEATLAWLESSAIHTRAGHGGVAHVGVHGAIAAAFDHWESRSGDPQLHTHVVIANRAQRVSDGVWTTLDSRTLYKATVAASEHYNGLLYDQLGRDLGTEAEVRIPTSAVHNYSFELSGVDDALIREFSSRSRLIDIEADRLIHDWLETHGREPSNAVKLKLRQQATLSTRTAKNHDVIPLNTRTRQWRERAQAKGFDTEAVLAATINRSHTHPLNAADTDTAWIDSTAGLVKDLVARRRATWNRWNLIAEAERVCLEIRCATAADRIRLMDAIATSAEEQSVALNEFRYSIPITTAPDLAFNGRSVFDLASAHLFTDVSTLANEEAIMGAHTHDAGPHLEHTTVQDALQQFLTTRGEPLQEEQCRTAEAVLASGRRLDAVVGPAGTGKTTTMSAVRTLWEDCFGAGTVVGLAPAAASADVLGRELGLATNNVSKWLYESTGPGAAVRAGHYAEAAQRYQAACQSPRQDTQARKSLERLAQRMSALTATQTKWQFRPNQLVIIDEASMVSTYQLAALLDQATGAGAKILLVGDPAQLDSIDAGGVLGWLERSGCAQRLSTVWRFTHEWERTASLKLRTGDINVITEYTAHERISSGTYDAMVDDAYNRWDADIRTGKTSILIAPDNDTVAMLNERAQADRVGSGAVDAEATVDLSDGLHAGRGDTILARRNDRRLLDDTGDFIRNGTLITVSGSPNPDGSIAGIRQDNGARIVLGAGYLAESVELGYATTAHRSQGITVDTGHTLVSEGRLTRELFYVSMTRGKAGNHAYISEPDPRDHHGVDPSSLPDWREILSAILSIEGAEHTAHEAREEQRNQANSLSRLLAEHDYLAQIAASDDITRLLNTQSPALVAQMQASPSWGAMVAAWRRTAGTNRPEAERVLVDGLGPTAGARDVAAVVHSRLQPLQQHLAAASSLTMAPVSVPTDREDLRVLLDDVQQRITKRLSAVAVHAFANEEPWMGALRAQTGLKPSDEAWKSLVRDVAGFRDRWDIDNPALPLGAPPSATDWDHSDQRARLEARITAITTNTFAAKQAPGPTANIHSTAPVVGPSL